MWLIGELLVLLSCVFYLIHIYATEINPDLYANTRYKTTHCFIIKKRLSTKGYLYERYRSDFFVSYHVDGVQYNRWVSGNGLDPAYHRDESGEEDQLTQYDIGMTYLCWFNPRDPQVAILIKRHNWLPQSSALVFVTALLALALLIRHLQQYSNNKRAKR